MEGATSSQFPWIVPQRLCNNPIEEGRLALAWLVHPLPLDDFLRDTWLKGPLHNKGSDRSYCEHPLSSLMIDDKLMEYNFLYGRDIDVVKFENGEPTFNEPAGRALPNNLWNLYAQGFTLNFKSIHKFVLKIRTLNASLQEYFAGPVLADLLLSPPNTQGYGPYYNDAETFILQMEGKKRWRLYEAIERRHLFPLRFVPDSEIGEPIFDTVVNPGDVLYFPKGTIHQSETIDNTYSLHINLEVYQKGDGHRYCSPRVVTATTANRPRQNDLIETFMRDIVPPVLSPLERKCCALAIGARMIMPGVVGGFVNITLDTRIRLLRSQCIRISGRTNCFEVYFSILTSENGDPNEFDSFEIDDTGFPVINAIIERYPDFVRVADLPIFSDWHKVLLATDLWGKCIVVTEFPLYPS